jgi:hypothetical protein
MQGWTDASVSAFNRLATAGERILLTIRHGSWARAVDADAALAAQWALRWRPQIQSYIHNYRAVTGVDLSAPVTSNQDLAERYVLPSIHLRRRLPGGIPAVSPASLAGIPPVRTQVIAAPNRSDISFAAPPAALPIRR